jgi:hypothetical protein
MVDQRTSHSREVVSTIRQAFQGQIRVFDAEIRLHVVMKDSVKAGVSILEYDPQSPAAHSYVQLANEVIQVVEELGPSSRRDQGMMAASAVVLPTLPLPQSPGSQVATLSAPVEAGSTLDEPRETAPRTVRREPLRFLDFLAGRDGWLGNGDQ